MCSMNSSKNDLWECNWFSFRSEEWVFRGMTSSINKNLVMCKSFWHFIHTVCDICFFLILWLRTKRVQRTLSACHQRVKWLLPMLWKFTTRFEFEYWTVQYVSSVWCVLWSELWFCSTHTSFAMRLVFLLWSFCLTVPPTRLLIHYYILFASCSRYLSIYCKLNINNVGVAHLVHSNIWIYYSFFFLS